MSRRGLARHNAKRDENEPELRKRFAHHGWHTEQVSGKGMPDLLAFNLRVGTHSVRLVDVKMPKGTLMPAQDKKWAELRAKGILVYVVRSEADVDALVSGTLEPWRPTDECTCDDDEVPFCAVHANTPRRRPTREPVRVKGRLKPSANYVPPKGPGVGAAQEAEETFAPGPEPCTNKYACQCATCTDLAKAGMP